MFKYDIVYKFQHNKGNWHYLTSGMQQCKFQEETHKDWTSDIDMIL